MRTTLSRAKLNERMANFETNNEREPYQGKQEIKRVNYKNDGKTGIKVTKQNHLQSQVFSEQKNIEKKQVQQSKF